MLAGFFHLAACFGVVLEEVVAEFFGFAVHAAHEVEQFDFAELNGVAFSLQGEGAFFEQEAILFDSRVVTADVATADLGFFVAENELAIDEVFDAFVAFDEDFGTDPLVAVEGGGGGVEAVRSEELAVALDVGAGGAEIGGGAGAFAEAAEELDFDGDGEILVEAHGLYGLAVDHDAAVPSGPGGAAGGLGTEEAVFDGDAVVGEFFLIEEMAEAVVEVGVAVVVDGEEAAGDAEGVGEVFAGGVAFDFGSPAGEVAAVEEGEPILGGLGGGGGGEQGGEEKKFHAVQYI